MKILQVTPRYAPRTGGVETHVRELATRLVKAGHSVTVVTADRRSDDPRNQTIDGVDVVRHRGVAPGGAFHVAPGVAATVQTSAADIVHAHNYHSLPLLFAAAAVGSDQRFVATPHYHGGSADRVRDVLLDLYRYPGGWALRRADAVIAVSDWERDRLARDLDVDARTIPNGIDRDRFADATPETRDRPYLLCVGRLEEYKGIQHVIRGLDRLPEYDLVVAGSGPYRDQLERIAERVGVADRVHFEGFVADDRLPSLYAGASVYVSLSAFEAFGMTVQEAIAAGTPCVVREAGALAEWAYRDGVASITSDEHDAVAAGIRSVRCESTDPSTVNDWNDVVSKIECVYSRS
ncbi:glycosyltransferase family 4 protein [Natronoarchaeum mannanilyticum]|uniref:Glycosyltransferase family 4 protein n=1 Tax=Natronoarchaeum mannanilyticum TaxID=926360 RepID=A0AAV3T9W9_9EURY